MAPNLLYLWRRLMLEGGSVTVADDDDVTSNCQVREMDSFAEAVNSRWSNTSNITVTSAMDDAAIKSRLASAARTTYYGMPQTVTEVRRFLRRWDGSSTIALGESFGTRLAALAAHIPHRSHLVLIAQVIATQSEIMRADLAGRYHLPHPVDPPRLVLNGKNRTSEILDMPLGNMLKRTPGRVSIIVGLRDGVGMVTG